MHISSMHAGGGGGGGSGRKVFVANLSYETGWQELKDHFKAVGNGGGQTATFTWAPGFSVHTGRSHQDAQMWMPVCAGWTLTASAGKS